MIIILIYDEYATNNVSTQCIVLLLLLILHISLLYMEL